MNKSVLVQFALLAEKQGYVAAATEIKKTWNKNSDWDIDWALRIAHLSEKFGYSVARQAIDNPDKFDNRTEKEKIADTIAGNNAHLNPDFGKEEKLYRDGGLEEVPGTNGTVLQMPKADKEGCSGIASMINQGTLDIMGSPDKNPLQAMADGELARKLQEGLK